jgi:hypothetical protein
MVRQFSFKPVPEDSIQKAVNFLRTTYVTDKYGRSASHLLATLFFWLFFSLAARSKSTFLRWTDFMSQMLFICPLQTAMDALAANGTVFGFDINDPNFLPFLPDFKNIHGVDLFYFWLQEDNDKDLLNNVFFGSSRALRNRMRQ